MSTASKFFRAVILGPPGSGKGTISSRIQRDFGLKHLSSGDVLRAQMATADDVKGSGKPVYKSEAAIKAKWYIERGQLVPDNLMVKLILNQLDHMTKTSWLLDGFPRTVSQARALQEYSVDHSVDAVISLAIPFDELRKRLESRWVHPGSGRVYNLDWNPPKVAGKDDETGEDIIQRDDDKPETVKARLVTYEKQTAPVIDFYREHNILEEFSGTETNTIWPEIHRFLQQKLEQDQVSMKS